MLKGHDWFFDKFDHNDHRLKSDILLKTTFIKKMFTQNCKLLLFFV